MARKSVQAEEPEGMVMTPMIDIVFQLLIFFVLVTDMARAQLENLTLPKANKATSEPSRRSSPSPNWNSFLGNCS